MNAERLKELAATWGDQPAAVVHELVAEVERLQGENATECRLTDAYIKHLHMAETERDTLAARLAVALGTLRLIADEVADTECERKMQALACDALARIDGDGTEGK